MVIWIVIGIVLFVLGNIMALKPSAVDVRLDKLRMTARRLKLNPKLVACPDWIIGKNNEYGKGMIGQYGIVIEGLKLPHVRYKVIEGQWQATTINDDDTRLNLSLNKTPLDLPTFITAHIKGLEAKANSIQIYWEDVSYIRPQNNPNYNEKQIETDLLKIKNKLSVWAELLKD